MKVVASIFGVIALVVVMASLAFGLEWAGIAWKGYFGPKHENVRRKVYEETQSFNEGKNQDLAKYFLEYQSADDDGKSAIRAVIQSQFSYVDADNINNQKLRSFLIQMRGF